MEKMRGRGRHGDPGWPSRQAWEVRRQPVPRTGPTPREVTLLTGDRVVLGAGRPRERSGLEMAEGGEKISVRVLTLKNRTLVVPGDAHPAGLGQRPGRQPGPHLRPPARGPQPPQYRLHHPRVPRRPRLCPSGPGCRVRTHRRRRASGLGCIPDGTARAPRWPSRAATACRHGAL